VLVVVGGQIRTDEHEAVLAVLGNDRRGAIAAAFHDGGVVVKLEFALLLFLTVAAIALRGHDRGDDIAVNDGLRGDGSIEFATCGRCGGRFGCGGSRSGRFRSRCL
jgi:hypothetical protein